MDNRVPADVKAQNIFDDMGTFIRVYVSWQGTGHPRYRQQLVLGREVGVQPIQWTTASLFTMLLPLQSAFLQDDTGPTIGPQPGKDYIYRVIAFRDDCNVFVIGVSNALEQCKKKISAPAMIRTPD